MPADDAVLKCLRAREGTLFVRSDDEVWNEWLKYAKEHGMAPNDLVYRNDVRLSLRARALAIRVVWRSEWLPCGLEKVWDRARYDNLRLDQLPPVLQLLATEMVIECVERLRADNYGLPSHIHVANYRDYQQCLLQLVKVAGPWQERALENYDLRDFTVFSGTEDDSGYNPFMRLMYSEKLPAAIKERADARMRKHVQDELSGKCQIRAKHEQAYRWYQRWILGCVDRPAGEHYSPERLLERLLFLLENAERGRTDDGYCRYWSLCQRKVWDFLEKMGVDEKWHLHLMKILLDECGETHRLLNYSEDDILFARVILAKLEGKSPALDKVLRDTIEVGLIRVEEGRAAIEQDRREKEAFFVRLR